MTLIKLLYTRSKLGFIFALLFNALVNIFYLALPLYMYQVFDRVLPGQSYQTLFFLTLIVLFILAVQGIFELLKTQICIHIARWMQDYIGMILIEKNIKYQAANTHELQKNFDDLSILKQVVASPSGFALLDLPWLPFYIFILYLISPAIALCTLAGAIVLLLIAFIGQWYLNSLEKQQADKESKKLNSRLFTLISVMGMMRLYSKIESLWHDTTQTLNNHNETILKTTSTINQLIKVGRFMIQVFVTAVAAMMIIQNQMTAGMLIACVTIAARALAPVEQLIGSLTLLRKAKGAYLHISSVVINDKKIDKKADVDLSSITIEAKNLIFVYPENQNRLVLQNINFEIKEGNSVAITGLSGSGSTTLIELICGIKRPTAGQILINGINCDIVMQNEHYQLIGYCKEQVDIFPGTIKDNITCFRDIDDALLLETLKLSGCEKFNHMFPNGLLQWISNTPKMLSSGDIKSIGLARAIVNRPKILLLDQIEEGLDQNQRECIIHVITHFKALNSLVFIVSRSSDIISKCSQVLVLSNGNQAYYGQPDKLISKPVNPQSGGRSFEQGGYYER